MNISSRNTTLIIIFLIFLIAFVRKSSGEKEFKNKVFAALFVIILIGLISQAALFVVLLPIFILLIFNTYNGKEFTISPPKFSGELAELQFTENGGTAGGGVGGMGGGRW